MKGISLPIEMIIILSISVIVLLAVAAYFTQGMVIGGESISDAAAWEKGCQIWKQRGCSNVAGEMASITISFYDPDKNGVENTLADACRFFLSYTDQNDCWNVCCATAART